MQKRRTKKLSTRLIKQLHDEIKRLKEDKEKLIIQLVEMEEIKDENKRLREQLDKLKSIK